MSALSVRRLDCPHNGIPITYDDDKLLGASLSRVEQSPVEHLAMHILNVNQYGIVFRTLGLMDRGSISQLKLPQCFNVLIGDNTVVTKIDFH